MENKDNILVEQDGLKILKSEYDFQIQKQRKRYKNFIGFLAIVFISGIGTQTILYKSLINDQNEIINHKTQDIIEKNKKISELNGYIKNNTDSKN